MIQHLSPLHRLCALAIALFVCTTAACGGKKDLINTTAADADKFLFQRGTEGLNKRKWLTAREFFSRIVDNYPQSQYRPDAKLGVGDTYLGDATTEAYVLAENEFREFLTFYPTHRRADYAQYKLGMAHFLQMRGPERDQTETRKAVEEFETFVKNFPNSELLPEVRGKLREARDRLSTSEYRVGFFYYRQRWYPGAIERLKALLKEDPGFTTRDAAYFYLAESLMKVKLQAEALPYYDRLVKEFSSSEFLERAKQRLAEFQTPGAAPAAGNTNGGTAPSPAPVTPVSTPPPNPAPPNPAPPTPPPTPPRSR
jgi:outer membrane protein assembly factor BamD